MQEVTFTLQTITELFLTGADQTTAELRVPSFRGLMRYWRRALVGGLVGTDAEGLKKVMEAETSLFGATDRGSAISLKISAASHQPREFTEKTSTMQGGEWQATGKGYLLWSMAKSGRPDKGNVKPARCYFPRNTSFDVTLSTREQDDIKLKQAIATFWLLTHLGGVGSRSRRCAGSLTVQSATEHTHGFSFAKPANAQALQEQLQQGIRTARALYGPHTSTTKQAHFDVLAKGACRIWILQEEQPWDSAEMAMKVIGEKLQDGRSSVAIRQRKIFGLPLMPIMPKERRSSPLLLRVSELQGNKFVGIAVLFKTISHDVFIEDYEIIEKWVNDTFPKKLEVSL